MTKIYHTPVTYTYIFGVLPKYEKPSCWKKYLKIGRRIIFCNKLIK